MRRTRFTIVAAITACLAACGGDAGTSAVDESTVDEAAEDAAAEDEADDAAGEDETEDDDASEAGDEAGEDDDAEEDDEGGDEVPEVDLLDYREATFTDPTAVDNRYFPLVPGTRHVYEGTALEDDELIERKVVFVVTDLTKMINEVETVVIWERDFNDDVLLESEIAFFAQDDDGNVWHFGQYRETYDEDEFVGGRVWLVDLPDGARAGIIMPAEPQPGPPYSQGYAPAPFNWTDTAAVGEVGVETCIELDCYDDVLVTEETDDENPGAFQLKYYAPGVGNVKVGFRGPDPEEEEMELVEDEVLGDAELAEARAEALAHEQRATMFADTTPAQPRD